MKKKKRNSKQKKNNSLVKKKVMSLDGLLSHELTPGSAIFTQQTYNALSVNGYKKNVPVRTAMDINANSVAEIPWIIVRKGDMDKTPIINELSEKLLRPNPFTNAEDFKRQIVYYILLNGNNYTLSNNKIEPDRDFDLVNIIPNRISPVIGKTAMRPIGGYVIRTPDGQEIPVPIERVGHLHTFDPQTQIVGYSPLATAIRNIDMLNEGEAWNVALLQNMCKPSGIYTAKEVMDDEDFERFKAQLKNRVSGSRNAGENLLLDAGGNWVQTSVNPVDMDWLESLVWSAKMVSLIFGVPPEMLGDAANKTHANYQEARRSYYQDTVIPMAKWIVAGYNHFLQPLLGPDLIIDIDLREIVALKENENELVERVSKMPYAKQNEKRMRLGLKAVDDNPLYELADFELDLLKAGKLKLVDGAFVVTEPEEEEEVEPQQQGNEEREETIQINGQTVYKIFNPFKIKDDTDRFKQELAIESQRKAFELVAEKQIQNLFAFEKRKLLRAIQKAKSVLDIEENIRQVWEEQNPIWMNHIKGIAMQTSNFFSTQIILQQRELVQKNHETDVADEENESYIEEVSAAILFFIMTTTITKVNSIIRNWESGDLVTPGFPDGNGIHGGSMGRNDEQWKQLETAIAQKYDEQFIPNRSELIAETEVVRASNLGIFTASVALGEFVEIKKDWITQRDSRVRGGGKDKFNHKAADGQSAAIGEAYIVSGEKLLFPGDISQGASPGNTIRCRCFLALNKKGL